MKSSSFDGVPLEQCSDMKLSEFVSKPAPDPTCLWDTHLPADEEYAIARAIAARIIQHRNRG